MNIATGDLAAQPASREELQGLVSALYERLREAEDERAELRKWADRYAELIAWALAMPPNASVDDVLAWIVQRPELPGVDYS